MKGGRIRDNLGWVVCAFVLAAVTWPGVGWGAARVALVIGNADYDEAAAKLRNPVSDATAVAAMLRRIGFEVIKGLDLDEENFYDRIEAFDSAARKAEMALFFYAGHGLQVEGRNYLAPVDLRLQTRQDLRRHAIDLAAVLEVMRSEINLVILDACRNNPLAGELGRSLGLSRAIAASRGLARVESASGTLIAYATEPGSVAADGIGEHSPYTAALLEHLETPGLSVHDLFTQVTASVLARTGDKQEPWTHSSLSRIVYLVAEDDPEATAVPPPPGQASEPASTRVTAEELAAERVFWESVNDSPNTADFEAYLSQYPQGRFAVLARNRLAALQTPDTSPMLPEAVAELIESELELSRADRRLIQLGLNAEGFDPGPADGLFGRETRGAIGRWQASRGEELTGYLDADSATLLLAYGKEHEALRQARRQLEERTRSEAAAETERQAAQARDQRKANQEAADDAAYEEAKSLGTVDSFGAYLSAYPSGRHAEEARRLLTEVEERLTEEAFRMALGAAQAIEQYFSRTEAFLAIAQAQTKAGDARSATQSIFKALEAADSMGSDDYHLSFSGVIGPAGEIFGRSEVFTAVAKALAEAEYTEEARRSFLQALTAARSYTGHFADKNRILDIAKIAKAQAEVGYAEDARESFTEALIRARRIKWEFGETERDGAIFLIAVAQAQAGYVQDAIRNARGIDTCFQRAHALSAIVEAQAQAGDIQNALETVRTIQLSCEDPERWATSLWGNSAIALASIAGAQAQAGNVEDARKSLSQALAHVERIATTYPGERNMRDAAFKEIALAQARAGSFREALQTAQRIGDGSFFAFTEIAAEQIKAGQLGEALEIVQRIEKLDSYSYPHHLLVELAKGYVRVDSLLEALETAQKAERGSSVIVAAIAEAQARTGRIHSALETAQNIENVSGRAIAFAKIAEVHSEMAVPQDN